MTFQFGTPTSGEAPDVRNPFTIRATVTIGSGTAQLDMTADFSFPGGEPITLAAQFATYEAIYDALVGQGFTVEYIRQELGPRTVDLEEAP